MEETNQPKKRVNAEAAIIGRNLMHLRHSCGMSQKQVAGTIGISFQQVQKYEKGQNRIPAEKLHRLKHCFGVSYGAFFEGLPDAQGSYIDNPGKSAKIMAEKMQNIKNRTFRRKLFKAFIILAS